MAILVVLFLIWIKLKQHCWNGKVIIYYSLSDIGCWHFCIMGVNILILPALMANG
jgi:hypothetical protein